MTDRRNWLVAHLDEAAEQLGVTVGGGDPDR
ncbi:hypothetical protein EDD34_3501 [Myceligenerans xiligouense]|uniref:Uncharacterized protein n=1 Tax=Myceligenerans xiligouense TaxID=253184 RepID=A0A3N4ZAE3_9MICO|nr:hypothetical protein EDD34_3501 [Myceligenerans xiligouense]